jgi:hypothetical protein
MLVQVAQHELSIYDKVADKQYRDRARRIRRGCKSFGIPDPLPFRDLKAWWDDCSKLPSYAERREYLSGKTDPVVDQLEDAFDSGLADWAGSMSETWSSLNRRIKELHAEFLAAETLDGFQDVGRRAVEILIAATDLVWSPEMVAPGDAPPKTGDAKAKFEQVLVALVPGGSWEELRSLMRASWRVANATKHSGGANRATALASAQAAILIAQTLHQIELSASPG